MKNEIEKLWSYQHKNYMWWVKDGDNYFGPFKKRHQAERFEKPFDITQHEWSDITMQGYEAAKCANGSIILNGSSKSKVINKQDGIAIAKALGVTAEDLK